MNIDRIRKSVEVDQSGCWNWVKSKTSEGYGQLTECKVYWTAHRYAFTCVNGPIPNGLVVRHLCHNRGCCNPAHLLTGTQVDNYRDSENTHRSVASLRRKKWAVNGTTFNTCREARKVTGLPIQTLIKYTKNGIFDVFAYRDSCKIAGWLPKL